MLPTTGRIRAPFLDASSSSRRTLDHFTTISNTVEFRVITTIMIITSVVAAAVAAAATIVTTTATTITATITTIDKILTRRHRRQNVGSAGGEQRRWRTERRLSRGRRAKGQQRAQRAPVVIRV